MEGELRNTMEDSQQLFNLNFSDDLVFLNVWRFPSGEF